MYEAHYVHSESKKKRYLVEKVSECFQPKCEHDVTFGDKITGFTYLNLKPKTEKEDFFTSGIAPSDIKQD